MNAPTKAKRRIDRNTYSESRSRVDSFYNRDYGFVFSDNIEDWQKSKRIKANEKAAVIRHQQRPR